MGLRARWAGWSRGRKALVIGILSLLFGCFACVIFGSLLPDSKPTPTPLAVTKANTATSAPSMTPAPTTTPEPTYSSRTPVSAHTPTATPSLALAPILIDPPDGYEIPAPASENLVAATVVDVVDGDTIKVDIDGAVYSLRYIGVDCPETSGSAEPVDPLGEEATAANRALVGGKTVYLEYDTSETDRYDRLLRYVWVDGLLVEAELVRMGYAIAKAYPPDTRYHDYLVEIENAAREQGVGLWAPIEDEGVSTIEIISETTEAPLATPTPATAIVYIKHLSKRSNPEYVEVCNDGSLDQDMAGWQIRSVKGDQWYSFPSNYTLAAGTCVRVLSASKATEARPQQLLWTTQYMWNNEEHDPAELYDAQGVLVDSES